MDSVVVVVFKVKKMEDKHKVKMHMVVEEWMNANKLVINPDKTHLMAMAA